jgi:hypothetical protein
LRKKSFCLIVGNGESAKDFDIKKYDHLDIDCIIGINTVDGHSKVLRNRYPNYVIVGNGKRSLEIRKIGSTKQTKLIHIRNIQMKFPFVFKTHLEKPFKGIYCVQLGIDLGYRNIIITGFDFDYHKPRYDGTIIKAIPPNEKEIRKNLNTYKNIFTDLNKNFNIIYAQPRNYVTNK